MNHLEQLVAEWLQYKEYFVRVSVPVGPRSQGGFEGELDVVGINPSDDILSTSNARLTLCHGKSATRSSRRNLSAVEDT